MFCAITRQCLNRHTNKGVLPEPTTCVVHHSGLDVKGRRQVLDNFCSNQTKIVFATSGFGAGIDVPDVCHVIHMHSAHGLVDYVQEIGRGGRDGRGCTATLFFTNPSSQTSPTDLEFREYAINTTVCCHKLLNEAANLQGDACFLTCSKAMCDTCNNAKQQFTADHETNRPVECKEEGKRTLLSMMNS